VYAHPKAFGGLFVDQAHGGTIVLLTRSDAPAADEDQWTTLVPKGADVRTRDVENSLSQLWDAESRVAANVSALQKAGVEIAWYGVEQSSNRVVVSIVDNDAKASHAVLEAVDSPLVVVRDGERLWASACSRSGACSPLRGGIAIQSSSFLCSAAFVAKSQTSSSRYLMSAGHCSKNAGPDYTLDNGTFIGTHGSDIWGDADVDALSIRISNPSSDNLLYVSEFYSNRAMVTQRHDSAQTQGSVACRSARSGYTCGTIGSVNMNIGTDNGTLHHQWIADFGSSPGNSGGAVFVNATWMGIVSTGNSTDTGYSTVDRVEDAMNVSVCLTGSC